MQFKNFYFKDKALNKRTNLAKSKFTIVLTFLFLLYFFSNNLIYAQNLQKSEPEYLIPIGNVLQIDAELKNIIVRNPGEASPLRLGDAIVKINNAEVDGYSDFADTLNALPEEKPVSILLNRGGQLITMKTTKHILEKISFNNLLSGFATLTYINPETSEFGAVGHPISVGNARKIPIKSGSISTTKHLNIEKSYKGSVGCINAKRENIIGSFTDNTDFGIRGQINNFDISNLKKYKVASLDEVKLGKAQIILQDNCNECKKYNIEIIDIENQKHPESKSFKIKITDKKLLAQTGGIVQGMSGTPIVQNDKIIGAVSHAIENDPAVGYAVFIKWML
ncbi:spoIVB peptidase S55 family protein [Clostridioides difficile CD160]|nr:spoIVB peptidase S55 family protein [Clostridioides difficile CD160]